MEIWRTTRPKVTYFHFELSHLVYFLFFSPTPYHCWCRPLIRHVFSVFCRYSFCLLLLQSVSGSLDYLDDQSSVSFCLKLDLFSNFSVVIKMCRACFMVLRLWVEMLLWKYYPSKWKLYQYAVICLSIQVRCLYN